MKKIFMATAVALIFGGSAAKADIFDYAELFGGVTQDPSLNVGGPSVNMKAGYNVGGALGWNIDPNINVDVDFFFTSSKMDSPLVSSIRVESFSAMVSGFYSFDIGSKARPYIGVGIGGVQVTDTDGSVLFVASHSDSAIVFGYQGMVGFTYPLEEKIDLIGEYRYQGASDATLNIGLLDFSQEYKSHNVSIGLRFHIS